MTDDKKAIALALYLHLPWVMDDEDVMDVLRETLVPLLSAHGRTGAPLTLAITGVLLERLPRLAPKVLRQLLELIDNGTVEIAATFYHEVYPHFLKNAHLMAQLSRDVALKSAILGVRPSSFYPANFAWSPILPHVLKSLGLVRAILDEKHLQLVGAMQDWKWNSLGQNSPLVQAAFPEDAINNKWVLFDQDQPILDLFFLDRSRVDAFTFGQAGQIHNPQGTFSGLGREVLSSASTGLTILADDADRVNALSIVGYEKAIDFAANELTTLDSLTGNSPWRIDYLPGYSLGDPFDFWLSSPESLHWLKILDEVESALDGEISDDFLALQDVYPLFWRTHWRSGHFWRSAHEILTRRAQASL